MGSKLWECVEDYSTPLTPLISCFLATVRNPFWDSFLFFTPSNQTYTIFEGISVLNTFVPIMKKFLIYIGAFLGIILLILVLIAGFFEDQIGEKLITEINKSLKTEISKESFDLSLIKGFPNASASLKKVSLPDDIDGTSLFEAEELSFRFNLMSLFGSTIKIKSVLIRDGAIFITYDKRGNPNYDIFKATESATGNKSDAGLSIALENASLQNMELIYVDEQAKQAMKLKIETANLSGDIGSNSYALESDAQFISEFIETVDGRYFVGKRLGYDAKIGINTLEGNYTFDGVKLNIEDNEFNVNGTIKSLNEAAEYDLTLDGEDLTLQSLLEILPEEQLAYFGDFTSSGDMKFVTTIKGKSSATKDPAIAVDFSLEDGRISSPKLEDSFKDVSITAKFTNGEGRNNAQSTFEIERFKGYISRELVEGKLLVKNLDKPTIDFELDGAIPMGSVYGLLDNPSITDGDGEIEINKFKLKGNLNDMINPSRIYKVQSSGIINFDDAMLKVNGEKMILDRGNIIVENNKIKVEDLKLEGAGSEIRFKGIFTDVLPVIFADSLNSKNAEMHFDAELNAPMIDMDKLLGLSDVPEKGEVEEEVFDSLKTKQFQERERITNFLKGTFKSNIKKFKFGKINTTDFVGNLAFDNNELEIDGKMKGMEGDFDLDGTVYFEEKPRLRAKLQCNSIDGTEFFRQTENFGQDFLTYENIEGDLDANIAIYAFWDEEGNFDFEKLRVLSDIVITDGELNDFKMLEDFSTFVKSKDLRQIRFTKTQNWLEIKNQTLYIPVMFIQSNALNMTLSGEHTFEQDIDYQVKVNAGQVAWNKMFKRPGEKPVKARNGLFNLYYRIFGNLDDYDFKSDKREIKKDFKRSEIRKARIKRELEKEFGRAKEVENEKNTEDVNDDSYDSDADILEGY